MYLIEKRFCLAKNSTFILLHISPFQSYKMLEKIIKNIIIRIMWKTAKISWDSKTYYKSNVRNKVTQEYIFVWLKTKCLLETWVFPII